MKPHVAIAGPAAEVKLVRPSNMQRGCRLQTAEKLTLDLKPDRDGTNAVVLKPCMLARGAADAHTRLQAGLHVSGSEERMTVDLKACDSAILVSAAVKTEACNVPTVL